MKPTVGRQVHFYDTDGEGPYAATVVNVEVESVTLWVLPRAVGYIGGAHGMVRQGEAGQKRVWCWPPK